MTQPQNTILNGPSGELTMAFKDHLGNMPTLNTSSGTPSNQANSSEGSPKPPPLNRIDSRISIQSPARPQGIAGQQFRAPPPRPPFPSVQQFAGRPPTQRGAFPNNSNIPNQSQNSRPQLPGVQRPPIIFQTRTQAPRAPNIFHQQSLPASLKLPVSPENITTSQALDPTNPSAENAASPYTSNRDAMKNRSHSMASNSFSDTAETVETRRMSVSSIGSNDDNCPVTKEGKSIDIPPRPESRSSFMKKIDETETKDVVESTNSKPSTPTPQRDLNDVKQSKHIEPTSSKNNSNGKPDLKGLELSDIKSPTKSEGDNDSGVDETTQGNDQSSNGDRSTPRKAIAKSGRSTATPTKHRSLSRGGRSPNPLSPDSTPSTPGATERKKLPMNKIQVGSAPSPNLKVVKSKIGSLQNTSYKPGGGNVKIEHKKIDFANAHSRIAAKNDTYTPGGGEKKIQQNKLQWNAKSKIGSLENTQHKPKGGEKKIETVKLDFKDRAKSKIGSKDNIKHVAGGGDIKIETKKIDLQVTSKIGSLDNVKHKAGGGSKKIFDDKEYLRQMSATEHQKAISTSQNSLPLTSDSQEPVSDENLNREN